MNQISRVLMKFLTSIAPRKKNEILENLFNCQFYAGRAFDTTHISLRGIYRSAKIISTKNPFEYIVPPPQVK